MASPVSDPEDAASKALLVVTDSENEEAVAAGGIVVERIEPDVFRHCGQGPSGKIASQD